MLMRMPEPIVFVRAMLCGAVVMAIWSFAYSSGVALSVEIGKVSFALVVGVAAACLGVCASYLYLRGAFSKIARVGKSGRADLLAALLAGAWLFALLEPSLKPVHIVIAKAGSCQGLLARWDASATKPASKTSMPPMSP